MTHEKPTPPPPTEKQLWKDTWFFLFLLVVLFWGFEGLTGGATCFICLRLLEPKFPRPLAMAVALAIGAVVFIAVKMFLSR